MSRYRRLEEEPPGPGLKPNGAPQAPSLPALNGPKRLRISQLLVFSFLATGYGVQGELLIQRSTRVLLNVAGWERRPCLWSRSKVKGYQELWEQQSPPPQKEPPTLLTLRVFPPVQQGRRGMATKTIGMCNIWESSFLPTDELKKNIWDYFNSPLKH